MVPVFLALRMNKAIKETQITNFSSSAGQYIMPFAMGSKELTLEMLHIRALD
jgi:hypothetical protein